MENEKITATYTTNYNIHNIDKRIKQIFEKEKEQLKEYEKELERLEWIKNNGEDSIEVTKAKKEIKRISEKYEEIKSGKREHQYLDKTQELLKLYDMALPPIGNKIFGMKKETQEDVHLDIRLKIIAKYLHIAKKYYPLNITRIEDNEQKCPRCNSKLEDKYIGLCCINTECGYLQEIVEKLCSHKEFQQTNCKIPYSKKENFSEGMRDFQGKQPKRPSDKILDIIDKEIEKYKIDKQSLTKHNLLQILKSKRLSDHYSDLNLIHSIITGLPPPDISKYEAAILHRYDLFEEIYEEIKPEDRQNSLHIPSLLWSFLTMEGYICNTDDFLTLKTREVVLEHDQVMKRACTILSKRYPYMNWTFTPRA